MGQRLWGRREEQTEEIVEKEVRHKKNRRAKEVRQKGGKVGSKTEADKKVRHTCDKEESGKTADRHQLISEKRCPQEKVREEEIGR